MPHRRTAVIDAVEAALQAQFRLIPATDAVQESDVPCVVMEEREENNGEFDTILARRATTLRRRLRFAVFAFGKTKRERDDVADGVEQIVVPTVYAILPVFPDTSSVKCALVGVGFSRSRLGTSASAFVAGQFYDAEYLTPSYL